MSINYSDSPSMDEILVRIKKALADREAKVEEMESEEKVEVAFAPSSDNLISPVNFSPSNKKLSFEEVKELSGSKKITDEIIESLIEDDIFIKPVLGDKKLNDERGTYNLNSAKVSGGTEVFVLTKGMKLVKDFDLSNVDMDLFSKNISHLLGKDLAISYLSPKMESWLKQNMQRLIKASLKKF